MRRARCFDRLEAGAYDAVIIAVGHRQFVGLGADGMRAFCKPASVLYDVKYVLAKPKGDGRL